MPLLGTMAGTLLPSLITKTNLLAAANKVLAVGKVLVNKQTYIAIGAHIKHTAAIIAEKAATLAAKAATWLLNAALATKVALLTLGVGVVAAAAAATYSARGFVHRCQPISVQLPAACLPHIFDFAVF
jgi:hypothetical protein